MTQTRLPQLIEDADGLQLPQGQWELTREHRIQYRRFVEETVALTGALVSAEATSLIIRIREEHVGRQPSSRLIHLRGRWEADEQNRLAFLVERREGTYDRLTFQGGWEIGEGHQLSYRYYQAELKTKLRQRQTLTFRGHWDLTEAHRIAYVLDARADSTFRFRGAFQTRSIWARRGAIRYQVGVEVEGRRQVKAITLFGKWKLSRDLALEFEIPYGDGLVRAMRFGATFALGSRGSITATLLGHDGRPIGLEVRFTIKALRDQGEAFVRLRRALKESAIEGGMRVRW